MTLYERIKAVFLLAAMVGLFFLVRSALRLIEQANRTLVYAQASLYSINDVGPQTVAALKTFDTTLTTVQMSTKAVSRTAQVQANKAGAALDGLATTLASINRPCGRLGPASAVPQLYAGVANGAANGPSQPLLPCGTLADVNRTLATVRGTFGQIEVAANHEDRNLDLLDSQERRAADDLHTTTVNLNELVASPDIKRFLAASADTSVQVAGIAKDVHKEADALTAPKPWYTKLPAYGSTAVNVACLVTHSCPF